MSNSDLPPLIPAIPPVPRSSDPPPGLPELTAADQVPIPNVLTAFEAILRQPRRVLHQMRQPGAGKLIFALLFLTIVSAAIYGVVVGTFSGGQQLWHAPLKIAGGLLVSGLICLPSLYIFSCLSGAQARFVEVFGLVAGLLTLLTVLLIGFAPVAWVFSQSTESLVAMGLLHLVFFFVAVFFGLRFFVAGFAHFNAKSAAGIYVWVIVFLLVALQMSTALRPLIGTGETFFPTKKKFFLTHWGDNMKESSRREQ